MYGDFLSLSVTQGQPTSSGSGGGSATLGDIDHIVLAYGWTTTASFEQVLISATVGGYSLSPDETFGPISAYLMTQIGPGTTTLEQVAATSFTPDSIEETHTFFSGLSLLAGSYFLVMTGPATTNNQYWVAEVPSTLAEDPSVTQVFYEVSATQGAGSTYAPASTFEDDSIDLQIGEIGFLVTVASVPEPSSFGLVFVGVLPFSLAWLKKTNRRQVRF